MKPSATPLDGKSGVQPKRLTLETSAASQSAGDLVEQLEQQIKAAAAQRKATLPRASKSTPSLQANGVIDLRKARESTRDLGDKPVSLLRRVYRFSERTISGCLAVVTFCPALLWTLLARRPNAPAWRSRSVWGPRGCTFVLKEPSEQAASWCGLRVLAWLHQAAAKVARGDMAWVGLDPLLAADGCSPDDHEEWRLSAAPGWISPWKLKRWGNCPFNDETAISRDYIARRGVFRDLGILLRAWPIWMQSSPDVEYSSVINILGIRINNVAMEDAVDDILTLAHGRDFHQICFVNADCMNVAWENPQYADVLDRATRVYADGSGVRWAGKQLGAPVRENVNGTDLFPLLCERLALGGERIFLLGGKPGVPEKTAEWIRQTWPAINLVGVRHGYYAAAEERNIVDAIAASQADILLVAFGSPKQDIWIDCKRRELKVKAAIGVGGLFDFYSGNTPRAPAWMREMGIEWAFRLLREPGRLWQRYLIGNPLFIWRVFSSKWHPQQSK